MYQIIAFSIIKKRNSALLICVCVCITNILWKEVGVKLKNEEDFLSSSFADKKAYHVSSNYTCTKLLLLLLG